MTTVNHLVTMDLQRSVTRHSGMIRVRTGLESQGKMAIWGLVRESQGKSGKVRELFSESGKFRFCWKSRKIWKKLENCNYLLSEKSTLSLYTHNFYASIIMFSFSF